MNSSDDAASRLHFKILYCFIAFIVLLLCAFPILGWWGKRAEAKLIEKQSEQWANEASAPVGTSDAPPQKRSGLTVKGFYIGMHTNELRPIVEGSFPDWSFNHAVDQPDWFMMTKLPDDPARYFKDELHVNFKYDTQGKVIAIHMTPHASDAVFNSGNMGGKEFVQTFMDAYGIPEMTPDRTAWMWNGKGVKVRIWGSKQLVIEKFSPEAARVNFN